ncbi:N-acetylmuramoyl-L-alanine amidase [Rhodococcus antarcticus]|jgi:N-acetylmuramoyl-L-alanine amidase|uniref:N-acetylmuramoyl-L-alanine amidase n=1 Tax=Rhodococcus antarcticus TaxID=2987751 RepID=A0ABY6NZ77_9NOCA|nr:N-acetylmuramoyl-L-alanine amidase [Rhodococcus antarcticus]UZJ24690.1 N-acetylmuramoyl-L-alanine amidase [Rhodococcus antarcticus]
MQLLRSGDRGPAVAAVRASLLALDLLAPAPAGSENHFDDAVHDAVRRFQQEKGLIVDGLVGVMTWRRLEEAGYRFGQRTLIYSLSAPMAGDDVAELQTRLLELGFNAGRHDGVFGQQTDAALRDFQGQYGLGVDGICGPATRGALAPLTKVTGGSLHRIREEETLRVSGPRLRGKRIVIDPGHGGLDRGSVGTGPAGDVAESDVVWDIATLLEGRMTATGMETLLTRSQSTSPADVERAALANSWGADLVLSLHADAHRSPRAEGVATFHFGNPEGTSSSMGELLASYVQRELVVRTGMLDGRTHARTWELLRRTRMPTVQVELGYLSNSGDLAQLADPRVRSTVADALLVAVKRLYLLGENDRPTGTFTYADLLAEELTR